VIAYSTEFAIKGLTGHSEVARAAALPNGFVSVDRKEWPPVTIAPVSVPRITDEIVTEIFQVGTPDLVMLVPRASHYDWSARELAVSNGSSVQTYKEVFTSLNLEDPRPFLIKHVAFAIGALPEHSRVTGLTMTCEAMFTLTREGSLPDVTIAVEYEYEFTQEALIAARKKHPEAQVYLNGNPNGRPTSAAVGFGEFAGVEIHRFAGLMSRLNRE
jgi:hypothetical protein